MDLFRLLVPGYGLIPSVGLVASGDEYIKQAKASRSCQKASGDRSKAKSERSLFHLMYLVRLVVELSLIHI